VGRIHENQFCGDSPPPAALFFERDILGDPKGKAFDPPRGGRCGFAVLFREFTRDDI
jgi:hypothetical protein